MGYKRETKHYQLVFANPELNGLKVTARGLNIGDFMKVTGIGTEGNVPLSYMLQRFAESLVDWNLEDEDGIPVPATVEGVMSQDMDFMMGIAAVWIDALHGVSPPLASGSTGVGPSLAESIPMETPSVSLAS